MAKGTIAQIIALGTAFKDVVVFCDLNSRPRATYLRIRGAQSLGLKPIDEGWGRSVSTQLAGAFDGMFLPTGVLPRLRRYADVAPVS